MFSLGALPHPYASHEIHPHGRFFVSAITIARLACPIAAPGQDFHRITGTFQLMHVPLSVVRFYAGGFWG